MKTAHEIRPGNVIMLDGKLKQLVLAVTLLSLS